MLEKEEIIAKVKKFLKDGCGCSYGRKESQCCHQFSEEAVLSNVNNCLELSHGELDLVVLANIQVKGKEDHVAVFCISTVRSVKICF